MALMITDLDGRELFVFHKHEYPEKLPLNFGVKLNKIEYPDDHYTNQIIGLKPKDMEFSGAFHGSYFNPTETKDNSGVITAKQRSDFLKTLLKKVVVICYAIDGIAGDKIPVIIEDYDRDILNAWHVEYKIKFVPHQPQTRVIPEKDSNILIPNEAAGALSILNNATRAATSAAVKPAAVTRNSGAGNQTNQQVTKPPKPPAPKVEPKPRVINSVAAQARYLLRPKKPQGN